MALADFTKQLAQQALLTATCARQGTGCARA